MLHLGQWIIDVEWKKGPRPGARAPVAAPTSPVKFDHFSLPVALDISNPSIGLAKSLGLVGTRGAGTPSTG